MYDATVETPILLITLSTPLPSAFTRFWTASSGSTPVRWTCWRARSSTDSIARYGLTAGGAEADQQRDVVHLADVAGLDHQPDLGAGLLAHQVVVDGSGEQQRRDRRDVGRRSAGPTAR